MGEDSTNFGLESCKTSLIAFDSLGVVLEADAALVGENNDDVARGCPDLVDCTVTRDTYSSCRVHTHLREVSSGR